MFFLRPHVRELISGTTPRERDHQLDRELRELAPQVAEIRAEYRHFGPYWWWIKPLLRTMPGARRSWMRGGYRDRELIARADCPYSDPLSLDDSARWTAWLGLLYYHGERLDDTPAPVHIVEGSDGHAFGYNLYDADASEQLDLFTRKERNRDLEAVLADPGRFSGSAWLQHADRYSADGDYLRGAAALRRAIGRAVDERDRTTAWIRLGQLFQENQHTRKAIYCYHNAWERDREGWIQGLLAEAYVDDGRHYQAVSCYEAALSAMPENPEYRSGLERCRRILREHAEAYDPVQEPLAR